MSHPNIDSTLQKLLPILFIFLFVVLVAHYKEFIPIVKSLIQNHSLLSLPLIILFQGLIYLIPIPGQGDALSIIIGAFFPFWIGSIIIALGWTVMSSLEYISIQKLAKSNPGIQSSVDALQRRLPQFIQKHAVSSPFFIIIGNWFPMGAHLVASTNALNKTPFNHFMFYSTIAHIGSGLFYAAIAHGIISLV